MPDWPRLAVTAGSVLAGTVAGYLAERLLLRDRHEALRAASPLGQIEGEQHRLGGPDGARLCVETYGPADSASGEVVLVHGFSLMGRCWHEQVVALRDRLRLVTYDHPGHGRSSRPLSGKHSLELLADALAAVIQQATDAARGKIVVVGHSMGGMTALACARRHPQLFERRVGALLL
ncbi:MAG: alpha/beta hydrolase [Actinomycetota bacterium]|nr:alpha/beta hydrolase [Actinomycetota bacterium]